MRLQSPLVLLLACASTAPSLAAQADRHELGLRLRAFERKLEATTDEARRKAAFVELDAAVQAFFGMNMAGVAEAVAKADAALDGRQPDEMARFCERLCLRLPQRLVDSSLDVAGAELQLLRFRRDEEVPPAPASARVVVRIGKADKDCASAPLGEFPLALPLDIDGIPEGDHTLSWRIEKDGVTLLAREQSISVAQKPDERLQALEAKDLGDASIEAATLQSLQKALRGMRKPKPEETILPGARLLQEAESLRAMLEQGKGEPYYQSARAGQFWLRVPTGKSSANVRMFVPASAAKVDASTLVVALHGAGGSENLFFDGYGDGAIVKLCEQRGWILCAPRSSGFTGQDLPALIEALTERYRVDRSRVLLIGHSMGAMQAVSQASAKPQAFAAVAALGGGGSPRKSDALAKVPFFVAAGERDFGRGGAQSLATQLEQFGVDASYREYPHVEHLAIVQIALPDVFAFFDQSLKGAADGK